MKFAYSRRDGGVSIIGAAPKAMVERLLGPLTNEAYEAHVRKAIPSDAVDVIKLPDDWEDVPAQFCRMSKGKIVVEKPDLI